MRETPIYVRECEQYMPECNNENCVSSRWTFEEGCLIYKCTNCDNFKATPIEQISEEALQEIYDDFVDNEN